MWFKNRTWVSPFHSKVLELYLLTWEVSCSWSSRLTFRLTPNNHSPPLRPSSFFFFGHFMIRYRAPNSCMIEVLVPVMFFLSIQTSQALYSRWMQTFCTECWLLTFPVSDCTWPLYLGWTLSPTEKGVMIFLCHVSGVVMEVSESQGVEKFLLYERRSPLSSAAVLNVHQLHFSSAHTQ